MGCLVRGRLTDHGDLEAISGDQGRPVDNLRHPAKLVELIEQQQQPMRFICARKVLQENVMHLLNEETDHRLNGPEVSGRRPDQAGERPPP